MLAKTLVKTKKIKKLASLLLAFTMILSIFTIAPISASAATSGDFEYKILDDGTAEITEYTGIANELEIPNELDGYTVTSIGDWAFGNYQSLTSVTIPDGVTNIGGSAFYNCINLESVTIPDGVTSISDYAFEYCESLTDVTIPNSVTDIGYDAFDKCTSLTSATIGNSVTSISDYAFEYCESLTSITIPDSVTSIGSYAFNYCTSLKDVTIGNSVTNIGSHAFAYCDSLTDITIPDSVISIGDCAFHNCTSLKDVTIGNSVTSIGDYAFEYCTSLTDVTIGNSVTSIGNDAFYKTAWYNNFYDNQPDGVVYIVNVAYGYKGEMPENTSIVLEDGTTGIADNAFNWCKNITSVTIPDSVTNIGGGAFYNCVNLESITIPDSVTNIGDKAIGYYYLENSEIIDGLIDGFTIYGYAGSAAETYANDNNIKFAALGETANISGGSEENSAIEDEEQTDGNSTLSFISSLGLVAAIIFIALCWVAVICLIIFFIIRSKKKRE